MYRIAKRFDFAAAHHLPSLPESHKCHRPHGHNYAVWLILESDSLDEHGFVLDYGEMDPFGDWIKAHLDHRDLNTIQGKAGLVTFGPDSPMGGPTAENIAHLLWLIALDLFIPKGASQPLVTIRVSETEKTWAEYGPGR